MGAFYTILRQVGVTNLMTTFTHSLGLNPANLVVRPIIHQANVTCTAPVMVGTIGTNIVTVAVGVSTLTTIDIEVQQLYSMIA